MLMLGRYLSALLMILVNISEVRPATSHRPVTLGPVEVDHGDHKWDMTGTVRLYLPAGPWEGLVPVTQSEAWTVCLLCMRPLGDTEVPGGLLISPVQARAHHFYVGSAHLSVF